jgi:hypothetical protein
MGVSVGLAGILFDLFGKPISLAAARDRIRRRLDDRGRHFSSAVRGTIYGHAQSPYLELLRMAGCEAGDLEGMVRRQGLEATLDALRRSGVYLTYDEFKGKSDVVRGGRTFRFAESAFDNPKHGAMGTMQTGGTRSRGTAVQVRLDHFAEQRVPALWMMLAALDVADAPVVLWLSGLPSGPAFNQALALAKMRRPLVRWFSLSDPRGPNMKLRNRLFLRSMQAVGAVAGVRLAYPEYAPADRVGDVLDGISRILERRGRAALVTTPSAAVRLAGAARSRGHGLGGLQIIATSEPLTEGKYAEITSSGARVGSHYISTETGTLGAPCGNPKMPDDVHFLEDSFAMLLHRRQWPLIGETDAFMLTTLSSAAPKILLNVEFDDVGVITSRRCGCALGELGLHTHLHEIRSFTKMSGEGNTLWRTNCAHVIEEILPAEFGGRSIDYQMLEAEDEDHLTRLFLIVSPSVGEIDEALVLTRFKEAIWGVGPLGARVPHVLQHDESIRLVRREPVPTARGKLLPFHTLASGAARGVAKLPG